MSDGTEASAIPETALAPAGYWVQAKPNKSWPEEMRALIRFYVAAKGEKRAPCAVCGRRKRGAYWTMLCPFESFTMASFTVNKCGTHEPLTLVCDDHPIAPIKAVLEALAVLIQDSEGPRG
jgi:hypothetical protein